MMGRRQDWVTGAVRKFDFMRQRSLEEDLIYLKRIVNLVVVVALSE
jgi:hypothetical protein